MNPNTSPPGKAKRLLCIGLGYTARALGLRLASRGVSVTGTARSAEGAAAIGSRGWQGLVLDGERQSPGLPSAIRSASHILVSAPPGDAGDPVLPALERELERAGQLDWIGYLSTVGVYGDHAGGDVDETTLPRNPGPRGRRRLEAERHWLDFGERHGCRVEVFRLPGIYGPGRSAIDQLRAGTARRIIKPGQVFNRIHVADIAAALEIAMATDTGHRIYNLTDDEPSPPEDVVAFAAGLMGIEPPPAIPFEAARLSAMAASFYAESKRVSNRRMKQDLGVRLACPTYREGLTAILAATSAMKTPQS
jgi:nucleoside-diphosphate-sugar epimerase